MSVPFGKKTVEATEIALAPIRPTTAGFKPDMQPLTVLLDLNFSKHRGLIGGWTVEDDAGFTPEILCALFTFSRYLEHENEFVVV